MNRINIRIQELSEKKLICKSVRMSLITNKTQSLWQSFMMEKKTIKNAVGTDLYSIQVYDSLDYHKSFKPQTEFTKHAAIEVTNFNNIPNGFSSLVLKSGLYAVFLHKGPASSFSNTIQFIFGDWLPKSTFELDERPHFEILGEKYKNDCPDSEEEVWIPIRIKT
jgi:AraC family transcriptional regulator